MNKTLIYGIVAAVVIVALSVTGVVWYTGSNSYVAGIAGEKITKTEYNYFLKSAQNQMEQSAGLADEAARKAFWTSKVDGKDAAVVAKENAMDNAKTYKILLMQAKDNKVTLTKAEEDQIKAAVDNLIQQMGGRTVAEQNLKDEFGLTLTDYKVIRQNFALINKFIEADKKNIQVTDEEIKKYYDSNKSSFEQVTVRHILFMTVDANTQQPLPEDKQQAAKKNADDILAKVRKGEDFAALAKQYSEDPGSKDSGGEYTFGRGEMMKEFEDWSFSAKPNDTGIVKTDWGYHVMKFEKKVQQPFDEVKEGIKDQLLEQKFSEQYMKKLEDWKKDPKYNLSIRQKVYDSIEVK